MRPGLISAMSWKCAKGVKMTREIAMQAAADAGSGATFRAINSLRVLDPVPVGVQPDAQMH